MLDLTTIAAGGTSQFQQKKHYEHTSLLRGTDIPLHKKDLNASFDVHGATNLVDALRYTVTYGHRVTMPSKRGGHQNQMIVAYLPEPVGSATGIGTSGHMVCSGLCLISPNSPTGFAHPFPAADAWINKLESQQPTGGSFNCGRCGAPTSLGHTLCDQCLEDIKGEWRTLL